MADTLKIVQRRGLDPGRSRRAVLEALQRASAPLTVRELRNAVREVDPEVRPSSVDDQLDVLVAEGRVAQINFGRRYELRRAG
jgi:Fe2+ or Zn2+ uptake regulation protein